jgi:uncharacterized protein (TIGR03437 family)
MRHKYLIAASVALIFATSSFCQILNVLPSRVLGHPNPEQINNVVSLAPNLVEGRELYQPQGIALDTSVTPPILYVSDTVNHRVLAWKNATSFTNGAYADLVIGQNNALSTLPQGPAISSSTLVTGFSYPSGMTVYKGDLYVVDSGNNRILRFPKPFSQTATPPLPDLVIGQPNLTSHSPNYAATLSTPINEQGIYTATSALSTVYQAGLAFDATGNLWFTDPGNARVLRFPAANIPAPNLGSTAGGIRADLTIGQPSLTSTFPSGLSGQTNGMLIKNQFGVLSTLGFDPAGRLFVVDGFGDNTTALGRVLVFATPSSLPPGNGIADRVMGVVPAGEIATLGLTGTAATTLMFQTWVSQPAGIVFLPGGSIGIVDTGNSRIMVFPSYDKWDSESAHYSPLAASVVGQGGSFLVVAPNNAQTNTIANGTPPASGSTFSQPVAAAFLPSTNELFVADTNNNRVMVMPYSSGVFGGATRILGQDRSNTSSPNLIEGREFQFVLGNAADAGIALDSSGATPHLFVSDPYNHRVLGYYDARLVTPGKKADLVIGQPDFQTAMCNYNPAVSNGIGGDTSQPTQSSLCVPIGLVVDRSGNLYVADARNGRVLRFPAPFANYPKVATLEAADLVLGQAGFTAQVRQASPSTMVYPYGLAFTGVNGLVVSDASLNRVLYFPFGPSGNFTSADSGKSAAKVFGQSDYYSKASGTGAGSFNAPLHVASDGEGRVYVADAGNNRVSIFPDPNLAYTPSGTQAAWTITGLTAPRGVWINPITDEIWITNTGSGTCVRYASFFSLYAGAPPNLTVPAVSSTIALTTDQNGALYVADASNRVAIYYPALQALNGANFIPSRTLAPGLIASLCAYGSNCATSAAAFGSQTVSYSGFPVPTLLGDVQVNFNGTPAPLFYVSPAQINFYVPSNAPVSGYTNVEVVQKSTGQVLAAGLAFMSNASPGIFMQQYTGAQRQAAVLNENNSINSQSNPAVRGHLIQIYATGQGAIPGMPADGVPAPPNGPLIVVPKSLTQVLIGTCLLAESANPPVGCANQPGDVGTAGSVASEWIPFSGLAPGFVGLWQINAQIPMAVAPGPVVIKVVFNNMASTDPAPGATFQTVIFVK